MQEVLVQFLGHEEPLEKEMATHSSILAWRIPWTEEPGRLQAMQSQSLSVYVGNGAFGVAVRKRGHKAAAFLQGPSYFFPFSVNSLLFSIGVELISETVFVSDVQELDSVMLIHRRLSILFWFLFHIWMITVCSINFPMLLSTF